MLSISHIRLYICFSGSYIENRPRCYCFPIQVFGIPGICQSYVVSIFQVSNSGLYADFWQVLSSLTYIPPIYLAFSISLTISVAVIFFFSLQSLWYRSPMSSACSFSLLSILCSWFAAFTYPAYATFKCIQSNDVQDRKDWLTYWIVYGVLHFGDRIFDLFLWWIPYYQQLKLAFLIWCFLPQFKVGSMFCDSGHQFIVICS